MINVGWNYRWRRGYSTINARAVSCQEQERPVVVVVVVGGAATATERDGAGASTRLTRWLPLVVVVVFTVYEMLWISLYTDV